MPTRFTLSSPAPRGAISAPVGTLLGLLALTGIGMTLAAQQVPGALLLPILSAVLILSACVTALVAWASPQPRPDRLTYWDVTGALTLLGICAALLSEPEQVVPLLEARRGQ